MNVMLRLRWNVVLCCDVEVDVDCCFCVVMLRLTMNVVLCCDVEVDVECCVVL